MPLAMTGPKLLDCLHRFTRDRTGVSAVEFAIILPFMLTLYLGGAELGDGMSIQFKATLAARTVADLSSQYSDFSPINSSTMSQILGAASTVVTPYPSTNMVVTVSELKVTNGNSTGTVVWSASSSGNGRSTGSTFALPTALQSLPANPNGYYYVILGEVTYPYTPSMGYVITGTINMYQDALFFPRMSNCVIYNGTPASC